MKIPAVKPASTLRFFSHYDQVIPAAIEGSGVAMGARPHLNNYLRDGVLCVPFGLDMTVNLSSFFIVLRRDVGGDDAVEKFVAWLRNEVRRDSELILAALHRANQVTAQPTHGTKGRKRANRL
jgi:DNA-binding transcriptional LysR family regulator